MTGPIVFLHIPKTAGQTIHSELERVIGKRATSPIRVHTQAAPGAAQLPPGFGLYSGHIDWDALDTLPEPRFVFTVLRDPLERIASFYFYICREAEKLNAAELVKPERTGMRMAKERSVDAYFCDGSPQWQRFVRDHYHSPYCSYLVSRRLRGFAQIKDVPRRDLVRQAVAAAQKLEGVYSVNGLAQLEHDLEARLGQELSFRNRFLNAAPEAPESSRWSRLESMIEREQTLKRLKHFVRADQMLMYRLGLAERPD